MFLLYYHCCVFSQMTIVETGFHPKGDQPLADNFQFYCHSREGGNDRQESFS